MLVCQLLYVSSIHALLLLSNSTISMELMKRVCPDSPYVWNSDGVSLCFSNLYP
ncbi:hypothetical protein P3S67_030905 [Capsicum chacoense]